MKKNNKKKRKNNEPDNFDRQEYLVNYITNFFGFRDVKVKIGNELREFVNDEWFDCKIIRVKSKDPEVHRILMSLFNPLYDSIHKTKDGTLTMSWIVEFHQEKLDGYIKSESEWEKELNRILLDFITMTLKPIGKF